MKMQERLMQRPSAVQADATISVEARGLASNDFKVLIRLRTKDKQRVQWLTLDTVEAQRLEHELHIVNAGGAPEWSVLMEQVRRLTQRLPITSEESRIAFDVLERLERM